MNLHAHHWSLDPQVRFLNHGSFGACPRAVLHRQGELRAELERQPVAFLVREFHRQMDEARQRLAAFLGAAVEDLAFVPNATTGVNAVLRSLSFRPGDEILVLSHAYQPCRNVVDFVAERSGARAVVVDLPRAPESADAIVEQVLSRVTDRCRLAMLDHVTSKTALIVPIERLVDELQHRGVDVLVDGAHAPGMVDVDLQGLGAAYYAGNCHKWLCAPKGAGFLVVRPDRQDLIRPTSISYGAGLQDLAGRSRYQREFEWTGTTDITPYLCVPHALDTLAAMVPGGWPEIRARNRALALKGRRMLAEALSLSEADLPPEEMIGSIASVPLPPAAEPAEAPFGEDPLQRMLRLEHGIEVQVVPWGPGRLLRISAQLYVGEDDLRALAEALGAMETLP